MRLLYLLQPLIDHLYIFQLLEYQSGDLLKWFFKHPFKRHLQRKQRIEYTAHIKVLLLISTFLLFLISYLLSAGFASLLVFFLLFLQVSPLFIVVAEVLFKPLESFQKGRIVNAAIEKRKKLSGLEVIAIVGSYAKTSTKNMLYTLLWKDFNIVKTPKSYNTELSIARSILSDLKETTEVFICEMDAYHPGEINQLCQIAQPTIGIITAIGPQHLERFGSIEKLAETQFELEKFIECDKTLFLNQGDEWSVKLAGLKQNLTWFNNERNKISNRQEFKQYQTFTLHLGKEKTEIRLSLKGEHSAINFLAAATIASTLGLPLKTIAKRALLIQPTEHRLEVRQMGNMTILDNTYNANPKAALASLALLASYKNSQKIVVTPGFVELGTNHHAAHSSFAKEIAKVADDVVIIGEHAKRPLSEGLKDAQFSPDHIHLVETTSQALQHLSSIAKKDTVTVLLENDLPDQYF